MESLQPHQSLASARRNRCVCPPLGHETGLIGDDYLVAPPMKDPLFYLPVQPPFIGTDPGIIAVDPNNPIHRDPSLLVASSFWKKKTFSVCGGFTIECPSGYYMLCRCLYSCICNAKSYCIM